VPAGVWCGIGIGIGIEGGSVRQVGDIIRKSLGGRSPLADLVAFPYPALLIGPPALKHIKSVALLRLADATVWMLVLDEQPWTDERLHAAAGILAGVSAQAFTKGSVESLLRRELGVRSLSLAPPPVDRIDEHLWEVEKVAFAWARRPVAEHVDTDSPATSPAELEWAARGALRDGLRETLRDFVSAMDANALRLATTGRRFDLRAYNYLAHTRYRQYRLQFAETFPSLLQTAVVAEPRSFGEELRSFVDTGAPLVKGLAARWNVRPGVVRHLVGRDWSRVGPQWSRDARGLALALDALNPQDLPGDDRTEWDEFNRIVVTGQRLFLRPVWESAAALRWLRVCVRLSKRGDRQALGRWLPRWNDIEQITRFRAALGRTLRDGMAEAPTSAGDNGEKAIIDAIDRVVLQVADQGLRDVATQFAEELKRTRKRDAAWQMRTRQILMPLVPEDFVTADGATRVTALTTDRELRVHGATMRNCLRSAFASSLARQGRIGSVFIVGLYDAHSGKALSTAEIRAVSAYDGTADRLVIRQHTATANRPPSPRCVAALQEFLCHCRGDEVQAHLRAQWRALRRIDVREDGESVHPPTALRKTLGERVYEGLLSSVREQESISGHPPSVSPAATRR